MKYCSKCGAPNTDDAVFCTACGARFDGNASIPPSYQGQRNYGVQGYTNQPQNMNPTGMNYQVQNNPQTSNQGSTQGNQGFNIGNLFYNDLETAKTLILIGLIFSIIVAVIFLFSAISSAISALSITSAYTSEGLPVPPTVSSLYAYAILYIIMMIVSFIIFLRVKKIYDLLKSGNVAQALQLNSMGWAVLGIIFAGLITGIMMLLARNYMEKIMRH